MALIEEENETQAFLGLIRLIISGAPIPTPTLPTLGDDRLIDAVLWGEVTVPEPPPWLPTRAGTMVVRSRVEIRHIGGAELLANARALKRAAMATGWLEVSLRPDRLVVQLLVLEFDGLETYVFPTPLDVGTRPLPALPLGTAIAQTAIVRSAGIVTLRFGTSPGDNVLAPPAGRLAAHPGDTWLIRVAPEVFTDFIQRTLQDGLATPPAGVRVEDAPRTGWVQSPLDGVWLATGSVGLEKVDACAGIFGDVDISVGIGVTARFSPGMAGGSPDGKLGVEVRVAADASDWDAFRCWAGTGGIGTLLAGPLLGPFMAVGGIGSLIYVGEAIRVDAGAGVQGLSSGGLAQVSADDSSVTYAGTWDLPALPDSTSSATIDGEGLTVTGGLPAVLRLGLSAEHTVTYLPESGVLGGTWGSRFDCSHRSIAWSYAVEPIVITDTAHVFGQPIATNDVVVWLGSRAEPASQWEVSLPFQRAARQTVTVRARNPQVGQAGAVIVHSSAGVRRFELGGAPARPSAPALDLQRLMETYCDTFVVPVNPKGVKDLRKEITELLWVEPPIGYHYGLAARQHWQVVLEHLPQGESIGLDLVATDGTQVVRELTVSAPISGPVAVELVAEAGSALQLSHSLDASAPRVRVRQRWLLPTQVVDLPGEARRMVRSGDVVGVLAGESLVTVSAATGDSEVAEVGAADDLFVLDDGFAVTGATGGLNVVRRAGGTGRYAATTMVDPFTPETRRRARPVDRTPQSLRLPDGRVVATVGQQLILAVPG